MQEQTPKQVRIIGDRLLIRSWIRSCYSWWRDGCNDCVACAVIDSYERGESSAETFQWRMSLLYDVLGSYRDGDHPLVLPRGQLQLFAGMRMKR